MAIITHGPGGRKPPNDTNDAPALDVAQLRRRAWALAARLDYLTAGAGRALNDATRQRMLRRMTRDAVIMARLATPATSRPLYPGGPAVEGGAA